MTKFERHGHIQQSKAMKAHQIHGRNIPSQRIIRAKVMQANGAPKHNRQIPFTHDSIGAVSNPNTKSLR